MGIILLLLMALASWGDWNWGKIQNWGVVITPIVEVYEPDSSGDDLNPEVPKVPFLSGDDDYDDDEELIPEVPIEHVGPPQNMSMVDPLLCSIIGVGPCMDILGQVFDLKNETSKVLQQPVVQTPQEEDAVAQQLPNKVLANPWLCDQGYTAYCNQEKPSPEEQRQQVNEPREPLKQPQLADENQEPAKQIQLAEEPQKPTQKFEEPQDPPEQPQKPEEQEKPQTQWQPPEQDDQAQKSQQPQKSPDPLPDPWQCPDGIYCRSQQLQQPLTENYPPIASSSSQNPQENPLYQNPQQTHDLWKCLMPNQPMWSSCIFSARKGRKNA